MKEEEEDSAVLKMTPRSNLSIKMAALVRVSMIDFSESLITQRCKMTS